MYELTGKIYKVGDVQKFSEKFSKREVVIEVTNNSNSDWNDYVPFEFKNDKMSEADKAKVGDTAKISFFVNGRKWEKDGDVRFFPALTGMSIEVSGAVGDVTYAKDVKTPSIPEVTTQVPANDGADDLPF